MDNLSKFFKKNLIFLFAFLCISFLLWQIFSGSSGSPSSLNNNIAQNEEKIWAVVKYVHDGDTFFVQKQGESKEIKIRLLGVDTPEISASHGKKTACKGKEVADFVKKNLEGKEIVLISDRFANTKDDFDRTLSYAEIDGKDLGEMLIEKGYAKVFLNEVFEKKSEYIRLEKTAQQEKKGIFDGSCT